jgi:hypothetical protein
MRLDQFKIQHYFSARTLPTILMAESFLPALVPGNNCVFEHLCASGSQFISSPTCVQFTSNVFRVRRVLKPKIKLRAQPGRDATAGRQIECLPCTAEETFGPTQAGHAGSA